MRGVHVDDARFDAPFVGARLRPEPCTTAVRVTPIVDHKAISVVTFEFDSHRFGLLASDVEEIVRAATSAPLPRAPAIVMGALDVRGTLVPVFDVRARFGLSPRKLRHTDHLILVNAGDRRAAIVVERVDDLIAVPAHAFDDARTLSPAADSVAGVAKLGDGTLVIYDLRHFLSAAEALELDSALAS